MACNLVRNKEGDIHNVFTDDGKPSILYNEINRERGKENEMKI